VARIDRGQELALAEHRAARHVDHVGSRGAARRKRPRPACRKSPS
jgi:hypothetical protein